MRGWVLILLLTLTTGAWAAIEPHRFPTEAQQQRYERLIEELRCLVCQNEAIAGSNADLARDMRDRVDALVREGRSDEEIKAYLVARYGDFVLFRPPVKESTLLLWYGPAVLLLVGAVGLWLALRRRRTPEPGLSEEERRRADALLAEERRSER